MPVTARHSGHPYVLPDEATAQPTDVRPCLCYRKKDIVFQLRDAVDSKPSYAEEVRGLHRIFSEECKHPVTTGSASGRQPDAGTDARVQDLCRFAYDVPLSVQARRAGLAPILTQLLSRTSECIQSHGCSTARFLPTRWLAERCHVATSSMCVRVCLYAYVCVCVSDDEEVMDAVSQIMVALSGPMASGGKVHTHTHKDRHIHSHTLTHAHGAVACCPWHQAAR